LLSVVRRVVAGRVKDTVVVDDLVQETLTRVLGASSRLDPAMLEPYAITTARNLVAGRPGARAAAMPRGRGRGKNQRNARPAPASTRRSQGCGMSCSVRGRSSPLARRVKIANLEARRGSPALSVFSIALSMRSWQAGKLISLLLFCSARAQWPRSQGRAGRCVTSGPYPLSLPSQRKTYMM